MSDAHPFSDIMQMAEAVALGGLYGTSDPNQIATLMLLAQAEGSHPMVGVRDYQVVSGKPVMKAEAMLSRFFTSGGKVKWTEVSDTRCAAVFSHPQGGEQEVAWTLEQAEKAGLTKEFSRKNNRWQDKKVWKSFPKAMLKARVSSDGPRLVFPVAVGIYTPEEVQDYEVPAEPPAESASKRVEEKLAAEPRPERFPVIDKDDPRRHLKAMAEKVGLQWPELRAIISTVTEKVVTGIGHLSPEEATAVMQAIEKRGEVPDQEDVRQTTVTQLKEEMMARGIKTPEVCDVVNRKFASQRKNLSSMTPAELEVAVSYVMDQQPVADPE